MKNVRLDVSYIGTNYCGFQRQKNGISIQEMLENAILKVTKQKSTIYMSGRTDSGVHAICQVVNFHTSSTIPVDKIYIALNQYLPDDIRVMKSMEVESDFHARKSAKTKTYLYRTYLGDVLPALDDKRVLLIKRKIDFDSLSSACKQVVGEHDFRAFMSTGSNVVNTVRTIYDCHFEIIDNYVDFYITGNGFLYNMVRILIGTILDVATNKLHLEDLIALFHSGERNKAGKTLPPYALYLSNVEY